MAQEGNRKTDQERRSGDCLLGCITVTDVQCGNGGIRSAIHDVAMKRTQSTQQCHCCHSDISRQIHPHPSAEHHIQQFISTGLKILPQCLCKCLCILPVSILCTFKGGEAGSHRRTDSQAGQAIHLSVFLLDFLDTIQCCQKLSRFLRQRCQEGLG